MLAYIMPNRLLKDNSSISMWEHIVTYVHSPNDADTARKNLKL